jgi:hypothetical protein
VETPVVRADGSVRVERGYDKSTRLYFRSPTQFPTLPEPTVDAARLAALELLDAFCDFPFVGDADRAATLAAIITIAGRHLIDGPIPLILARADTPGAGKGKLVDGITTIATGRQVSRTPPCDEDEELRKRLTTFAIEGTRVALLDNCVTLGGQSLDAVLTSTRWSDRVLGVSRTIDMPWSTVLMATGNNPRIVGDTTRRILPIRLSADCPNPESRTGFKHSNLIGYLNKSWVGFHANALTILRAGLRAQPTQAEGLQWGSYESWCAIVRRSVICAYGVDPLATREGLGDGDDEMSALRRLIGALMNEGGLTASQLIERAERQDGCSNAELREALHQMATGRDGRLHPRGVGAALRKYQGRPVLLSECVFRLRVKDQHWAVTADGAVQTALPRAPHPPSSGV